MPEHTFQPDWFSKPGDTIATLMAKHGLSRKELAEQLRERLETVKGLLAGVISVDKGLAKRLSDVIGGSPEFWLKRQEAYDQSLARAAERIPAAEADAWLKTFPTREMDQQGWVSKAPTRQETTKNYLAYFGVSSPEEWQEKYSNRLSAYSFRTSPSFNSSFGSLIAWLRQGEIEASAVSTRPWDAEELKARLPALRKLSMRKAPSSFIPKIQAICAEAGVAVVVVKAPSGCKASGATRFITNDKAMIVLSFRYLTDDHFWFTLFHEIGHLVLHGKSDTFIDGASEADDEREEEANEFAASALIPGDRRHELETLSHRSGAVVRYSVSVGVGPGVVVGQMQHLGLISRSQLNFLKRRYKWETISAAVN